MVGNSLISEKTIKKEDTNKDALFAIGDKVILLGQKGIITEVDYNEPIVKVLLDDGVLKLVSPFVSESILKKDMQLSQSQLSNSSFIVENNSSVNLVSEDKKGFDSTENIVLPNVDKSTTSELQKKEYSESSNTDTVSFSLALSRDTLCYSEYCCKEQLTLSVSLENLSEIPLGKFSVVIKTSSEILIGLDKWSVTGSLEGASSNKSSFTISHSFALNPQLFRNLSEKTKETITATLISPQKEELANAIEFVEVQPMDYWNGSLQAIPFFIERNNPDVIRLQKQISQAMLAISGTNALDAYQSENAYKVLNQCAAIYSTLQSQELVYTEPKQSDDLFGQRIRLASEILRDKMATCLDSTVLFCALAESIGLHSIVCVTEGHAFPGVWLEKNKMFDSLIHDDPSDIVSLSEPINQKLCVIESTMMTMIPTVSFKEACNAARNKAIESDSIKIIDIQFARKTGISPIPRKIPQPNGDIVYEDDYEFNHEKNVPTDVIEYNTGELNIVDNTPKTRITSWERKLISLSSRSPLLNENVRSSSLLILHPNIDQLENDLENGVSFSLVSNPIPNFEFEIRNDLQIQNCSEILLKMAHDKKLCTGEDENKLEKKLKLINRKAQNELSETGVNPLFLSIGHIEWIDKTSMSYCAPILLYPVSLIRKTRREFVLSLRDGEEPQLNYSIFEKMTKEFGISLSLDYDNLPRDEQGLDIRRILQIVKHDVEKEPKWRVGESCLLGLFSFDQYILWNDIHKHSEQLLMNKAVYSLANGCVADSIKELPNVVDSDYINETIPVSCDESQMRAVKAAGGGYSFILQGPPGTGKSQTITAMIVDALTKGKKVLFVAEKMAALQVVYRNLCKVKCSDYLLEMHSTKLTKSHLIEQLEKALERHDNNEIRDAHYINNISVLDSTLNEYVEVLHKKRKCGLSLYELLNKYDEFRGLEDCQLRFSDIADVTFEDLDNCFSELVELSRSLSRFMPISKSNFRFFHFTSMSDEILSEISSDLTFLLETSDSFSETVMNSLSILDISNLNSFNFSIVESLNTIIELTESIIDVRIPSYFFSFSIDELEDALPTIKKYKTTKDHYLNKIDKTMNPAILKNDIPALLREWDSIKIGIFKAKRRKEFVSRISSYSSFPITESEIEPCLRKLNEMSFELESVSSSFNAIPDKFRDIVMENCEELISKTPIYRDIIIRASKAIYYVKGHTTTEKETSDFLLKCKDKLSELKICSQSIKELHETWNSLMAILDADDDLKLFSSEDTFSLIRYWKDNINSFIHWGRCNSLIKRISKKPYAKHYLDRVISGEDPAIIYKEMTASYIRTQIEAVVLENPILERYDDKGFLSLIDQLEGLENKYREYVIKDTQRRLNKIISERKKNYSQLSALRFFISTKGKKRSIRSLFSECNELITNLFPCLLMSPMSVSQFFEAGNQVFDLVIMDEASQIQTCKAIGAIARGKELIVVGDSKQMPPTSFFNKTTEDNEYYTEDESLSDLDSILEDCARIDMPQLRLNWHYRSKNESLIHFSNTHYYNHKLKTYPSTDSMVSKVKLKKVKGFYQSDSKEPNPSEAEAIIVEIVNRLKDPILSKDSIGVITFNEKQQSYIIKELDKRFEKEPNLAKKAHWDENEIDCPNKLIVKNLENIQGDERDIIMLSVTFGKTKSGRFIKNFGPIGKVGGEKRLNVAFSRAKKEMLVFTIIDVAEFASQELNSRGANDLKEFLKFASKQCIEEQKYSQDEISYKEIASILSKKGYQPIVNVGLSDFKIDIALKNPDKEKEFFCAILFDGSNMKSATLTNDRFILRKQMLIDRGWKVIQVRIMDWYNNPDSFIATLVSKIEEIFLATKVESLTIPESSAEVHQEECEVIETSYGGEYMMCELPYDELSPSQFLFFDKELIANKMKKVIEVEGPIIDDLLEKRVLNSYGIKKRGKNIREFLDSILDILDAVFTSQTDTEGIVHHIFWPESFRDFVDSIDDKYISFRIPYEGSDSKKRQIGEYPQIEIRNAMASCIRISGPTIKEALFAGTSSKLGFKRNGKDISDTMDLVLRNALKSGYMVRNSETGRIDISKSR